MTSRMCEKRNDMNPVTPIIGRLKKFFSITVSDTTRDDHPSVRPSMSKNDRADRFDAIFRSLTFPRVS